MLRLSVENDEILSEYRKILRLQHKAFRTEKSYTTWVRRFLTDIGHVPRSEISADHVRHFLSYLAVERQVAVATQEQAFNAPLFLCRHVLHIEIDGLGSTIRCRRPRPLPVVLSPMEAQRILEALSGRYRRMAMLMYGCGLRLEECLRLRVMDIDFDEGTVTVRARKRQKDRISVLPRAFHDDLRPHIPAQPSSITE